MRWMAWAGLAALLWAGAAMAAAPPVSAEDQAHIAAIEQDLASPILLKGTLPARRVGLAQRMAALHVPGASIAFVHDGRVAWTRTYGVAAPGVPVTADTLFQAASISKPLTALAVLHLVEQGRLDLDTDVNRYLKTWKLPASAPMEGKPVTIRELLTHTAGLTVHGFPGYGAGETVPSLNQVLDGVFPANSPPIWVDTPPGTTWRYSGGGYVIPQKVIEDTTGQPLREVMRQLVLEPIGMTHSTFEQPLPASRRGAAAVPYGADGMPAAGGAHTYPEAAPAALWTTPGDLGLYIIEVQKALAGQSNKVISQAMAREMLKPGGLGGWGLGPQLGGDAANPYFTHSGGNFGFLSLFLAFDQGDGFVVMINGDGGGPLLAELMFSFFREYGWPGMKPVEQSVVAVAPGAMELLAGTYQGGAATAEVVPRDGRLFVRVTGLPETELFPLSAVVWAARDNPVFLRFEMGPGGRAAVAHLLRGGADSPLKRVDPAEARARAAALAERIRAGRPSPGTETWLRRYLDSIEAGTPDYSIMAPSLESVIRLNAPTVRAQIAHYGQVRSIAFKAVDPGGADDYIVEFQRGRAEFGVTPPGPDGKVETATYGDLPWSGKPAA
jgi:CubicO group peptidase (beta-lactamase class C family)